MLFNTYDQYSPNQYNRDVLQTIVEAIGSAGGRTLVGRLRKRAFRQLRPLLQHWDFAGNWERDTRNHQDVAIAGFLEGWVAHQLYHDPATLIREEQLRTEELRATADEEEPKGEVLSFVPPQPAPPDGKEE
jgi:hypothetical protein